MSDLRDRLIAAAVTGTEWTADEWRDYIRDRAMFLDVDLTGEVLWHLAGELATHRQTIKAIEDAVAKLQLADVRRNGPVRFGDQFIKASPKSTREIVDLDGLVNWATKFDPDAIPKLFRLNADNLRITTLRSMAERWLGAGDDSDIDAVMQTFIEEHREDDTQLSVVPIDRAPKYAKALGHGQRVGSFTND